MTKESYFKRLKHHRGISAGIIFPIIGALAGASNPSLTLRTGLIFGFLVLAIPCWLMILISNIKK